MITKDSQCSKCKKEIFRSSLVYLEANQALCMICAKLNNLIFLGCGDHKLTRRAKKYSSMYIIVLKFSSARKRSERQGILVTQEALEKAQSSIDEATHIN